MLSSTPTIVQVTAADRDFLFDVYMDTRLSEVASWGWTPEQLHSFLHMQFVMQQSYLDNRYPQLDRRLINSDQTAIGQMTIFHGENELRLVDLAVLSRYRNQGAGTFILQELQRQAAAYAIPIRLQVRLDNPRAQRLYQRLGWHEISLEELHMEMEWSVFQSSNGGVRSNE
ncbi:GNAT family N-acetyltransferase [Paenibacillus dauci]|uniref:GNAT family N-acetyltransferase n=1 Tax=Paenibacillus dauci TaxID=1567106 RepID=UPI0006198DE0|nr:GNAT family N-acetyltransferase [Paenibacillus dauci]